MAPDDNEMLVPANLLFTVPVIDLHEDNPFVDEDILLADKSECSTDYGYDSETDITGAIATLDIPVQGPVTSSTTTSSSPVRTPGTSFPSAGSSSKRKAPQVLDTPNRPTKIFRSASGNKPVVESGNESSLSETSLHEPVILTWPPIMAPMFSRLPFGIQYELARLVTTHESLGYGSFLFDHLKLLAEGGTHVNAMSLLPGILRSVLMAGPDENLDDLEGSFARFYEKETTARSPWKDLDLEEVALKNESPLPLMGFDPSGSLAPWFGGKIIFRGTLERSGKRTTDGYRIKLEAPELGPSTHLGRRFGSKSIFRLKVAKRMLYDNSEAMLDFVRRPLLLCDGVYRAFYAKELTIFFIRTNETSYNGKIDPKHIVDGGMSFFDFLHWANPPEENCEQGMAKYSSRFALLLSSSVPGYLLSKVNLCFEDDIVNPETNSNMTDGAGSIGRQLMIILLRGLDWAERPSAIQVRVHGAKGLLVDDKAKHDDQERIYLTPSQRKIFYSVVDIDPARYVIDMIRVSRLKSRRKLSVEIIINLAENGVPAEVFSTLLRQMLEEQMEEYLDWESPGSMIRLYKKVETTGGIVAARRARENPGTARLNGYNDRDEDETNLNELQDDDDEDSHSSVFAHQSAAWWPDSVSGSPSALEETVMDLLASGFNPKSCPVLAEKLGIIIKGKIHRQTQRYQIEVPMSCMGMIVPDKRGLLEEGEVYFRTTSRELLGPDCEMTDIIIGDVLLARYPCKLPTDVQKFRAVNHPGLHDLAGVIVLSTKGTRRAADLLSGGDYDGDKALVMWYPPIVESFKPADIRFADPPDSNFHHTNLQAAENIPVRDFIGKVQGLSEPQQMYQWQGQLLRAMRDPAAVGSYSNFHENALQMLGYQHPETIRLAQMFCSILDGAKTGLKAKEEVEKHDRNKYHFHPRPWKARMEDKKAPEFNPVQFSRDVAKLGPFIMDQLYDCSVEEENRWIAQKERFFKENTSHEVDRDLYGPYEELKAKSLAPGGEGYKLDAEKIRDHVQGVYLKHQEKVAKYKGAGDHSTPGAHFTNLPIETRQNRLRAISRQYAQSPEPSTMHMTSDAVRMAKASYAYIYDCEQNRTKRWSRFPWDVAFRDLCDIKAKAIGLSKTVTSDFYHNITIKLPKQK